MFFDVRLLEMMTTYTTVYPKVSGLSR